MHTVPLSFRTGTIIVAHSENYTGAIISSFFNLSNSPSAVRHMALPWLCKIGQKLPAQPPTSLPSPSPIQVLIGLLLHARSRISYTPCDVWKLKMVFQPSLSLNSQSLPNKPRPFPPTTISGKCSTCMSLLCTLTMVEKNDH